MIISVSGRVTNPTRKLFLFRSQRRDGISRNGKCPTMIHDARDLYPAARGRNKNTNERNDDDPNNHSDNNNNNNIIMTMTNPTFTMF